ncbi:histidine phosphatase family protein [Hanamia caeni]|uniref:Histidine phosphatase family protein n=1 Tax=Hanamia caeni TaxID=2294116 RepID=A0A3M9NN11_9BACT|nr:histidine phosphatase family protein [Hanamia caeni]RNI38707.1 histidine phosphatase family protein [Hanamia caeni]
MKIILMVRHAKSGLDNSLIDFDRKLTEQGKTDAKNMTIRLVEKNITIDLFISSPAARAQKTASIFMKELAAQKNNLKVIPALYEPSVKSFYEVIESVEDEANCIALFSHNPGITQFVNSLDCHPVYDMPTCAVYAFKIKSTHWNELQIAEKEFLFFDFPKNS